MAIRLDVVKLLFGTNAGVLLIGHVGTNVNDILVEIQTYTC